MGLVEKMQSLADEKNVKFAEVERATGISNGQLRRWDSASPKTENLQKVADYFGVSTDYLLGRSNNPSVDRSPDSTDLDKILDNAKSFDGKPMTDNDRAAIRAYLEGRFSK